MKKVAHGVTLIILDDQMRQHYWQFEVHERASMVNSHYGRGVGKGGGSHSRPHAGKRHTGRASIPNYQFALG